jgi:hypothetical protein
MYEFLILSRDKFKNTLLAPLREVHAHFFLLLSNIWKPNFANCKLLSKFLTIPNSAPAAQYSFHLVVHNSQKGVKLSNCSFLI